MIHEITVVENLPNTFRLRSSMGDRITSSGLVMNEQELRLALNGDGLSNDRLNSLIAEARASRQVTIEV